MKNTTHSFRLPFYLSLFFISVLVSCSENNKTVDNGYYFENFDNLKMWSPNARVTSETVHSGSFSAYTDSSNEYSETFQMDLAFAKSKGYKTLNVSAWCFKLSDDTKAGLITSVEGPEQSLVHESADLATALKNANTWGNVSSFITLPETILPGTKIKVYVWAPKKQKVYLDDVELSFHK